MVANHKGSRTDSTRSSACFAVIRASEWNEEGAAGTLSKTVIQYPQASASPQQSNVVNPTSVNSSVMAKTVVRTRFTAESVANVKVRSRLERREAAGNETSDANTVDGGADDPSRKARSFPDRVKPFQSWRLHC